MLIAAGVLTQIVYTFCFKKRRHLEKCRINQFKVNVNLSRQQ